MSKNPRRANYSRKLARRIVLADGRVFVTLQDAADLLTETFGSVNTQWGALDHGIRLLIEAAEQGGKERIAAATAQIELVLRARRPL